MKKVLFHITQYGNLHSIKKHGLVDNLHDGIFFTDDDMTSLGMMKSYFPKCRKFLCCSFEVDTTDERLYVSTDRGYFQRNDPNNPAEIYMFMGDIHPSDLTLEVVELNRDGETDFYEVENTIPYQTPPKSLRENIMKSSLKFLTTGGSSKMKDKLLNYPAWFQYCYNGLAREDFLVKNGYKEALKNIL